MSSVLQLDSVSKVYQIGEQELYALKDVSLQVNAGESLSIVGTSGSGKSTLLHIASLLDYPSSGEVRIKEKATSQYDEPQRAKLRNKEIGFIFQQFNLLPKTTAIENVELPLLYSDVSKQERFNKSKAMLEKVGLGERMYNTSNQLSGGQQQRVAIARALVTEPAIIFADEPTGNLDSKSGADIEKLLLSLNKEGKTLIIVTHDQSLAKKSKRVVTLKDGRIESDNAHT